MRVEYSVQWDVSHLWSGIPGSTYNHILQSFRPTHPTSQNKSLACRLSSAPCHRDEPETELSPRRDSPRFHALALLALKSNSNSSRELSKRDSPHIDPPKSNTHRKLSR